MTNIVVVNAAVANLIVRIAAGTNIVVICGRGELLRQILAILTKQPVDAVMFDTVVANMNLRRIVEQRGLDACWTAKPATSSAAWSA